MLVNIPYMELKRGIAARSTMMFLAIETSHFGDFPRHGADNTTLVSNLVQDYHLGSLIEVMASEAAFHFSEVNKWIPGSPFMTSW